jgi:hypothetical protein
MVVFEAEMSPKEWLHYQREKRGHNKMGLPPEDVVKIGEDFKKRGFAPLEVDKIVAQFSKYSLADVADIAIEQMVTPIYRILTLQETQRVKDVFIGAFPTYSMDAYTTKTPRGDKVIMLHEGLILSFSYWTKLFICEMEHEFSTESSDFFEANRDAIVGHLAYLSRLWINDDMLNAMDLRLMEPRGLIGEELGLTRAVGVFILGHELGHVIEGHYTYSQEDVKINHLMEQKADLWGLRICLRDIIYNAPFFDKNVSTSKFMFLGPFLGLGLIGALSKEESFTHPSAIARLKNIKDCFKAEIKRMLPPEGYKMYERNLGIGFEDITLSLGEKLFMKHLLWGEIIEKIKNRNIL